MIGIAKDRPVARVHEKGSGLRQHFDGCMDMARLGAHKGILYE